MTSVAVDRSGTVLVLTIDRPDAHNALNTEVITALAREVRGAADDSSVRAIVITGRGDRAFSAGADLKQLATMSSDDAHAQMTFGQSAFREIERSTVPVVTAVNGVALGGGFELVLASTFPVLSTRASLGLPESGLGLIPGYGGTQRLPRAVGKRVALHLMLTGARLDADRAYALGITPVPPTEPESLLDTALDIARTIATKGPIATRSILHAVDTGADGALDSGLAIETGLAAMAVAGTESTEGIDAFLTRRPAAFDMESVTAP